MPACLQELRVIQRTLQLLTSPDENDNVAALDRLWAWLAEGRSAVIVGDMLAAAQGAVPRLLWLLENPDADAAARVDLVVSQLVQASGKLRAAIMPKVEEFLAAEKVRRQRQ